MKKILVIDVGGTNLKLLASGQKQPFKIPSGPTMTGQRMIEAVRAAVKDWDFDAVSIGYPAPVVDGKPARDPWNLAPGWVNIDFEKAFKKPVKIINDAAMQALGSYEGGRMLFLGLGTGLGSTLIVDNAIAPMELAHLPYKKKQTFEDYVGQRGLDRLGKEKWRKAVHEVVTLLKNAMVADYVVLGGGNARHLDKLPEGARLGSNDNAFKGGFRLWQKR
jgi:polyphosphate glucokinase